MIALDVCAAGGTDLDKGKLLAIKRMFFQKALDGEEALQNTLRVIDAIYSAPP